MSSASIRLLSKGWSDIGAPTRRISRNARQLGRTPRSEKVTAVRPDARYQASTSVETVKEATVAMPAPVIPSAGIGPMPNTSVGTSSTCRISAAI